MKDREFHPAADVFPLMGDSELNTLAEDIAEQGLLEPIVVTEDGSILDGRNRWKACKRAGVDPDFEVYRGDNPLTYSLAKNLKRRQLSSEQKAAVATEVEAYEAERAKERRRATQNNKSGSDPEKIPEQDKGEAREKAAEQVGTNERYVSDAKRIQKDAPDVYERMKEGRFGNMSVAKKTARLDRSEREEVHEQVDKASEETDDPTERSKAARDAIRDVKKRGREQDVIESEQDPPGLEDLDQRYSVILADPPWQYNFSRSSTRRIENHYSTMGADSIGDLPVQEAATDDSILFLWGTTAKLPQAIEVMQAWGYEYKTSFCWVKDKIGMGYYCRNQHELLLIGKRGDIPPPDQEDRVSSVIQAPRGEHSKKPERIYSLIESMYPGNSKLELFARNPAEGWAAWGAEADGK